MKDWDYKEILKHIYFEVRSELKKKEQALSSDYLNSRGWSSPEDEAYAAGKVDGAEEARKLFESHMDRMYRKEGE